MLWTVWHAYGKIKSNPLSLGDKCSGAMDLNFGKFKETDRNIKKKMVRIFQPFSTCEKEGGDTGTIHISTAQIVRKAPQEGKTPLGVSVNTITPIWDQRPWVWWRSKYVQCEYSIKCRISSNQKPDEKIWMKGGRWRFDAKRLATKLNPPRERMTRWDSRLIPGQC